MFGAESISAVLWGAEEESGPARRWWRRRRRSRARWWSRTRPLGDPVSGY